MTGASAQEMIEALRLAPHPEGGWYRETWRAEAATSEGRGRATAILFLLEPGQKSHWHKVDAAELWLFQAGSALTLRLAASDRGPVREVRLGADVLAGEAPQQVVPPGEWQAAEASAQGWALVACVVAPAFRFEGFELAPPGWAPASGAR